MSIHSQLTGSNVHQPRGAESASNGQVITADGTGSTSWVDLFINRLLAAISVPATITDNTGVSTDETTVETTSDAVIDKNFHAVVTYMNTNTTAIINKLNELITLLQDLNITRGS